MKYWKHLLTKEWNDAYDMYENVEDVLGEYSFAIVDTINDDILMVSKDKSELIEEVEHPAGLPIGDQTVILDIENDEVHYLVTSITWQKNFYRV